MPRATKETSSSKQLWLWILERYETQKDTTYYTRSGVSKDTCSPVTQTQFVIMWTEHKTHPTLVEADIKICYLIMLFKLSMLKKPPL